VLDKGAVISAVERYAETVRKELSPSAIILFGSLPKNPPTHEEMIFLSAKNG